MLSGIQLEQSSKTKYYRNFKDEKGFAAEIIMNPRDAMVFAHINRLPDEQTTAVTSLREFISIVTKNYGAKATINISPKLLQQLPEGELKSSNGVGRYISVSEMKEAIQTVENKIHVARQLEKFTNGEYQFLTKKDLYKRSAELSEFKIKYSSFVDKNKIENGQYSKKAEDEKLNNPYVEHYAIQHKGKIIACIMHLIHGDKTYDADFVVHPDYRSKDISPESLDDNEKNYPHGLAQALCVKVYRQMLENHTNITGSWLIAGGYGGKGVGARLYDVVFPSKQLKDNPQLQNEVGLFLMFGAPGTELLLAANRDLTSKQVNSDEKKYIDAALAILAASTEPDLAAKQPQPLNQEKISPVSVFTNPDKTPIMQNQMNLPAPAMN